MTLECSVMLNYRLKIVGDESVTSGSIDHYDEFCWNSFFDRSNYRTMCIVHTYGLHLRLCMHH